MPARQCRRYTLEEYFDLELSSEERYEYRDGEAFDLSGDASFAHVQITSNLIFALHAAARKQGCYVFGSNLRIKVPAAPPYRYADLTVCCGAVRCEKVGGVDALINPSLIVETLSPSTEAYDRGDKFTHYKSVESFAEYLLIAQHRPHATHFVRRENGRGMHEEFNDLDASVRLVSLDRDLPLHDVYLDVEFPLPAPPPIERPDAVER